MPQLHDVCWPHVVSKISVLCLKAADQRQGKNLWITDCQPHFQVAERTFKVKALGHVSSSEIVHDL